MAYENDFLNNGTAGGSNNAEDPERAFDNNELTGWRDGIGILPQSITYDLKQYTSDLTGSGTATADSDAGAGHLPSGAFDNTLTLIWTSANTAHPHWLKYDFGVGNSYVVTQYTIQARNDGFQSRTPKDFKIQGSNDDSSWTDLDIQTGITYGNGEKKTFNTFSEGNNTTSYRYYRIYSTVSDGGNYSSIGEMEYMATVTEVTKTAGQLRIKPRLIVGNLGTKDFSLWGSNLDTPNRDTDGNWTSIFTGQTINNENWQEFTLTNSTAYRHYRIKTTSSWSVSPQASFWEIELKEETPPIVDSTNINIDENKQFGETRSPFLEGFQFGEEIEFKVGEHIEFNEGFNIGNEEITISENYNKSEGFTIGEVIEINQSLEKQNYNDTFQIGELTEIFSLADIDNASKIIHYNPLIVITDTDPIKIVKVNITNPEIPTFQTYILNTVSDTVRNAKDIVYNETFGLLYVACADGKLLTLDINDFDTRSEIDLSDTNDVILLTQYDEGHRIFAGTDDIEGEVITFTETQSEIINTDLRFNIAKFSTLQTSLNLINARIVSTDFRFLSLNTNNITTDIRFFQTAFDDVSLDTINRPDFVVYINNVSVADLQLSSINIFHTIDEHSLAKFTLGRYHDKLDYTLDGTYSQITNQNDVRIEIKGHVEFTGKISRLDCNSNNETVVIEAKGDKPSSNKKSIVLPMTKLNNKFHLYDIIVENPVIYNPYIDPNEEDPEFYNGIKIDLGKEIVQKQNRIRTLYDSPVSGFGSASSGVYGGSSLGSLAFEIMEQGFNAKQNWSYFWGNITAENFLTGAEHTAFYVGTSLSGYSADSWLLLQVKYRMQRIYDDVEEELGEYTVGSAPFKEISVKNGKLITKPRWEDRDDGLYEVTDEGYDYIEYAKIIADLELDKLRTINGDILPKTSADIELSLDGYYYYNPKILTRINISDTTDPTVYNNNNGFPVSIKGIEINSDSMKVTLQTDNSLSREELKEIEDKFPDPESDEYLFEEKIVFLNVKYDPNRDEDVV